MLPCAFHDRAAYTEAKTRFVEAICNELIGRRVRQSVGGIRYWTESGWDENRKRIIQSHVTGTSPWNRFQLSCNQARAWLIAAGVTPTS